jgi:uncharacterized protein DUF2637
MVTPTPQPAATLAEQGTWGRMGLVWVAGLIVALGAGVATAHGLYEVALAAGTPRALAWLYPLITDGLALVAYATTTRLAESGRRYAATVVVIAAGLSGLTQASYLAGGVATAPRCCGSPLAPGPPSPPPSSRTCCSCSVPTTHPPSTQRCMPMPYRRSPLHRRNPRPRRHRCPRQPNFRHPPLRHSPAFNPPFNRRRVSLYRR